MFESQIIRIFVYLLGGYTLFAAVQQLIATNVFEYQSWVLNAVGNPSLANIITTLALPIGFFILTAAFFNRRSVLLLSLGLSTAYQFGAAILNAIDTTLLGTPSVPALFIGLFAGTMYAYYRLKPEAMHIEDKVDNSIDGFQIIEKD